ncbi:hypothetical protein ACS0TY_035336 [Phlomoides rotata]
MKADLEGGCAWPSTNSISSSSGSSATLLNMPRNLVLRLSSIMKSHFLCHILPTMETWWCMGKDLQDQEGVDIECLEMFESSILYTHKIKKTERDTSTTKRSHDSSSSKPKKVSVWKTLAEQRLQSLENMIEIKSNNAHQVAHKLWTQSRKLSNTNIL